MSRKNKNIIMCIVLTILVILLCFTVYRIKLNISNTPHMMNFDNMEGKEIPNGGEDEKFKRRGREKKSTQDEDKKTDESDNSKSNNTANDDFKKEIKPPEMSEDNDSKNLNISDAENMKKDFPRKNKGMGFAPNKNTDITTFQYVLIGIESFGISIIVIYLIMTSFNKKTIKDVVSDKDNIIICVLATIILTFGLIFGSSHIIKNMSINNYSDIKVIDEKEFESKTKEKNTKEEDKSSSKNTSDESSESA